ncbi:MAG: hypothetical protein GQ557_01390, partial [Mycoplasmataceae bacterium]|nr:hypothetical protein [Mycoplasmataceae bacterium]
MNELEQELKARIKRKDINDNLYANARAKAHYVINVKKGDWYVYVPEYEEELKLKLEEKKEVTIMGKQRR